MEHLNTISYLSLIYVSKNRSMLIDLISVQNKVKKKICTESKLDLLDVSPPLAVSFH